MATAEHQGSGAIEHVEQAQNVVWRGGDEERQADQQAEEHGDRRHRHGPAHRVRQADVPFRCGPAQQDEPGDAAENDRPDLAEG